MTSNRQSTPPNQGEPPTGPRQSSRLRTPLARPGFVPTHTDSQRTLVVDSVPTTGSEPIVSHPKNPRKDKNQPESQAAGATSLTSGTAGPDEFNIIQDSDDENKKANKRGKNIKGGFDHPKKFFFEGSTAEGQENGLTYKCRWCPKSVRTPLSTSSNLKTHRDGSINASGTRKGCPGRAKAIADGAKLPPSAEESVAQTKKEKDSGTLTAYIQKGRFDIKTLNKIVLFWMIRQSLPWTRIDDFFLGVAFDYSNATAELYSRTWAAVSAWKLYLNLQSTMLKDIKDSGSKISLVADVWTTKGNHKAFIGISVCYINRDWQYVLQHLSMKYISWHHNGKYLALPFANVLIKNGLHDKIHSLTTDTGSNNFTMVKEMAQIIRGKNGDFEHYLDYHPRCFCHVLALILGAGLKSIKLQKQFQDPSLTTKPDFFPMLDTIEELDEDAAEDEQSVEGTDEIQEVDECDDCGEVDPDDASIGSDCNLSDVDQGQARMEGSIVDGFGHTLVKVDYISRRICSSAAKRAEFNHLAQKMRYKGPQLIPGYGIRWNVAYNSWTRAYSARKVIVQLLSDESNKYAGKSAAGHYFKGYEVTNKEWEDLNSLNQILEEFLVITLRMEGDGPSSSMVLYEYTRLIGLLEARKKSPEFAAFGNMFDPMIKVANEYLELALRCDAILLATMLHPAWRLSLIKDKFPEYSEIAEGLLDDAFQAKLKAHQKLHPPVAADEINDEESENDEFNYYPTKSGASQEDGKLKKYKEGVWPLGRKSDPLLWWKAHASEFPQLSLVARDVLACAGSSASVERTFSAAADICSPVRNRLAATTIERCVSSHLWLRSGIKAGGEFADAQAVIDTARSNKKFASHVAKLEDYLKGLKIRNVGSKNK